MWYYVRDSDSSALMMCVMCVGGATTMCVGGGRLSVHFDVHDDSDMLTLDDFFDLYYAPANCFGAPLDAQVVWPLPPSLNF